MCAPFVNTQAGRQADTCDGGAGGTDYWSSADYCAGFAYNAPPPPRLQAPLRTGLQFVLDGYGDYQGDYLLKRLLMMRMMRMRMTECRTMCP